MLSPLLPTRTSYPDPSCFVFSDTESCRFNEANQVISLSSHLSYTNRRDTPKRKTGTRAETTRLGDLRPHHLCPLKAPGRNLTSGKRKQKSLIDYCSEINVPALVSHSLASTGAAVRALAVLTGVKGSGVKTSEKG